MKYIKRKGFAACVHLYWVTFGAAITFLRLLLRNDR